LFFGGGRVLYVEQFFDLTNPWRGKGCAQVGVCKFALVFLGAKREERCVAEVKGGVEGCCCDWKGLEVVSRVWEGLGRLVC